MSEAVSIWFVAWGRKRSGAWRRLAEGATEAEARAAMNQVPRLYTFVETCVLPTGRMPWENPQRGRA